MRIYEGFWDHDGLCVWAMDSQLPAVTASRKRHRPHPYAVDPETLATELGGDADTRILRLPSRTAKHPLPPPQLPPFADAPRSGQVALRPWSVPVCYLTAGQALATLERLGRGSGDLLLGPSLRHIAALAEAAATLVATRRVLPQLVSEELADAARWRPVLDRGTHTWLRSLVRSLPPVARAHHPEELTPGEAGTIAMGEMVTALCAFVDARVRTALAGAVPPPTGTTPKLRDQWLHALTNEHGTVPTTTVSARQLDQLLSPLRSWFTTTHAEASDIRLTFRLLDPPELDDVEELGALPERGAQHWRLELWVQSTTEPSLMVPVGHLWQGAAADWLPAGAQEAVLRTLGRAARIYPPLAAALDDTAPTEVVLDLDGAHEFLSSYAMRLSNAGYGVLLPRWAGEQKVGLKLHARSSPSSSSSSAAGSGATGEDIVNFDFRAAVGDTELTEAELTQLAQLKQPLVRLRGEWVRLDPKTLRAAARFLREQGDGSVDMRAAMEMVISPDVDTPDGPVPITSVQAEGRLGELLDGSAAQRIAPLAEPAGFTAQLRPYQARGAAWLAFLNSFGLGAILADDMGLGKTVQLLAVLAAERETGQRPGPTLLICPVSLIGNWHREAQRFTPNLAIHVHHGPSRPHDEELAATVDKVDLVLTSYGLAMQDGDELAALTWARVVCDEAQAIKNPGTRQARAIRAIPAPSRIALTGTPVENHLGELWSLMEFTNPGLLGSQQAFRRGLAAPIETAAQEGADTPQARNARHRLARVTRPFVLRRLKTDSAIVSDLPEKQEMKTWCTLTAEQASLYQATVDEMTALVDQAEGIQRRGLVLATMTKLKQVCNHPAHLLGDGSRLDGRSGKLEALCDLLAEMMAEGDKALCFTQYTDFGDRLAPYLAARLGVRVLWLHGSVSRTDREEMVRTFQEEDTPMVLLLSLRAGGTGLNLTAANQVIHVDRWWNPAVENQATDRAFRIGQQRTVQVRTMVCLGTLEERIDAMMERKAALADSVVGTGEDWLGELSGAELREVIRLAPEAVEG
ncbi:DEAD/DEAH box helicase [Lipingzhangella sp. LS1_29]|uniref:DEAD/DEAH box helicase n=1 Tax=Lipingzhangella rawalii TaxID=2055835 RepID=A0ABU2H710_9ACTN|nr:DEAD/DEAH box helicase [Lipingzhangella rawalii]MDS1270767.1 DEAD/DEAH box helicase [Lipingzhangella rawalii]